VLALNNLHAAELSFLAPERLSLLLDRAFRASRIGRLDAFLLAFDQAAAYDSPNFLWFRQRYERFAYVDRVVVASHVRGRGYARLLYEDLFARAAAAGHDLVACEVNSLPPNPASDAFHRRMEFVEVGTATIEDGGRAVRYYVRRL
jgi:predicted GNAT superfamily acetyltransferase